PAIDAGRRTALIARTERLEQELLELRGVRPAELIAELVPQPRAERGMSLPGRERDETRLLHGSDRSRIQARVAVGQHQRRHPAHNELLRVGDDSLWGFRLEEVVHRIHSRKQRLRWRLLRGN